MPVTLFGLLLLGCAPTRPAEAPPPSPLAPAVAGGHLRVTVPIGAATVPPRQAVEVRTVGATRTSERFHLTLGPLRRGAP